jgi:hypothetical protein
MTLFHHPLLSIARVQKNSTPLVRAGNFCLLRFRSITLRQLRQNKLLSNDSAQQVSAHQLHFVYRQ